MTEETKGQRKLAAIMFTDMVGYSALSQRNEALALELLEEHRQILRPIFAGFGGHEIEAIGDAFLVEFESALEAVRSAIEIQRTLRDRNLSLPPERTIRLRIGLHLGDVVHLGNRVHGDGVNIAARIEPLAEPGGICLSEDIVRQIRNKVEVPLVNLGKGDLKNIRSPLDLYKVVLPWEKNRANLVERAQFRLKQKGARWVVAGVIVVMVVTVSLWLLGRQGQVSYGKNRVVVLPFANISAETQDEYFADGMTEEIISNLSKISGLDVIARTSVMKYKTTTMDVAQIGQALMVGTILEGSVRKVMDKARITVQLIDVPTQRHLWTEDYDRQLKDVFAIQSDIAQRVAEALKVQLVPKERESIEKKGTENLDAYRNYLLGLFYFNKKTGESLQKALEHFQEAVALDSGYALAYTGLADSYTLIGAAGYGTGAQTGKEANARTAAMKSLELDPSLAEAHASLAYIKFRFDWDWKGAGAEFSKAIDLKPGYAKAHEWYALYLGLFGRNNQGIAEMQRAYELDPLSPSVSTGVGRMYQLAHRFPEAIAQFKRTIEMEPTYADAHFTLGLTYAEMGKFKESLEELNRALDLSGRRPVILANTAYVYVKLGRKSEAEKIYNELANLVEEKRETHYFLVPYLLAIGQREKALDMLEKAYEEHSGFMVYLKAADLLDILGKEPRYIALLKKIGFDS